MGLKKQNKIDYSANPFWFLVVGVSLTTLYFNLNFIDPFNTPKLLVILLFTSWLAGHLLTQIKNRNFKTDFLTLFTFITVGTFLSSYFIATILTDDLKVGFFGDTYRRNGFLAYLGLCIFFLTAFKSINSRNIIVLFKVTILTGSLFSFYSLLQISGNDFVDWDNPYNAIIATVGNPNFASALMSVFTVLAITILFSKNFSKVYKAFSLMVILMSVLAIVLSNSRQGLVSLVFSLLVFISLYLILTKKKLGIGISIFSLIFSSIITAGMLQTGPLSGMLYKTSITIRGYYWDAGLKMFKDNILFGVGIDSYGYFFKEYRDPGHALLVGYDLGSTNAHNIFIQFFATGGIIVGLSYVLLVLLVLVVGIKLVFTTGADDKIIVIGLLCGWLAFQAQSIISIDNLGISVWGWLLGGSILGLYAQNIKPNLKENSILTKKKVNYDKQFQLVLSSIFFLPALILVIFVSRVEASSLYVKSFLMTQSEQNTQYFLEQVDSIARNPIADDNYKLSLVTTLYDLNYKDRAYSLLNDLLKNYPRNQVAQEISASIESLRGNFPAAIENRMSITQIDPWNAKNYLELLILYKNNGQLDLAESMFKKIEDIAPKTREFEIAKMELS
jgi:O-antigen ligase